MTTPPSSQAVFLDTSVVIEILRANTAILRQLAAVEAVISAIVVGELYLGAHRSKRSATEISKIAGFAAQGTVIACDYDTGVIYGGIKNVLQ